MFSFRLRLPFGTLKFKTFSTMRWPERHGVVPSLRCGRYYLCWWSNRSKRRYGSRRDRAYLL